MNEAPSIDTATLKRYLDEGAVHVVEVLMPKEYESGHIPGAINIHFAMIGGRAARHFGKSDRIVTYCHDDRCRASRIAASKLHSLGYTNTYHYPGGKNAWIAAGHPLERSDSTSE